MQLALLPGGLIWGMLVSVYCCLLMLDRGFMTQPCCTEPPLISLKQSHRLNAQYP